MRLPVESCCLALHADSDRKHQEVNPIQSLLRLIDYSSASYILLSLSVAEVLSNAYGHRLDLIYVMTERVDDGQ